MNEETKRILDMVAEGTLSVDDAVRLLDAVGSGERTKARPTAAGAGGEAMEGTTPSEAEVANGGQAGGQPGPAGAVFAGLTPDQIVECKIHGVTPEYIAAMRDSGFANLSIGKLVECRIHGVDRAYVEQMRAAGLGELPLSKLIEFKIHGVDAGYARELMAAGR